jgi:dienelactone hydrolase
MRKAAWLCVALLAISPLAAAQAKTADGVEHLFDYDAKQPLDIQQTQTYEREGGVKVIDLTYASPRQGRVTAFLVLPAGKGPFAAILFGHWGGGNRTEFLSEAELYARAGAVSLLIDYPWTRPAQWRRDVPNLDKPEVDVEIFSQAVVDLRRGFDLLLARPDVDAKRVAYVGHSFGAQFGAILSAVDRRMKTSVLMGGTPTEADIWMHDPSQISDANKDLVKKYLEVKQPLNAIGFIGRAAPIPLFFQFANFEQNFSREAMERYYQAASQPKEVKWYDTGHDLNDPQALIDRAAWLAKQIGVAPVAQLLEAELKRKSEQ